MRKPDQLRFSMLDGLFEQIYSMDNLTEAFRDVRRNRGVPGVDDITIKTFGADLQKNLSTLAQEVSSWKYKPSPVKGVEIPKPNGGKRKLGIPTVKDRVLHASIKNVLEPIFEPMFSDNSYGFRPKRNQEMAVKAARNIVHGGKDYVLDMDLSKFFDRISHDRLIYRLGLFVNDKRVLRLIGIILRSGILKGGVYECPQEGSVQGSPLSPLLSNIVLDELDKELEKRGLEFCRYADDSNIFFSSEKAANRVRVSITRFIEKKLKLVVNQEKTKVAQSKFVKFLGMTVLGLTVCISSASMEKAMDKVEDLTPRRTNLTIEQSIEQINQWYMGWSGYYKMTDYPSQLLKIEAHIRRRLRARIMRNKKKKRNILKFLITKGVTKRTAGRAVYSNKGIWALSITRVAHLAMPNKWFSKVLGFKTRSDKRYLNWNNMTNKMPSLS